jgi:anti-sigma B factor antagonist
MLETSLGTDHLSARRARGFECTLLDAAPAAAVVRVVGELDMATAPLLQRTLLEACGRAGTVLLDLRDLTFIDSSGLHVVIDATREAEQRKVAIVRLRAAEHVERVFKMTGTAAMVAIVEDDAVDPAVRGLLAVTDGTR